MSLGWRFTFVSLLAAVSGFGCATEWRSQGTLPRTAQTIVHLKSEPTANVLVDGLIAGRTPLSIPLTYRGSMERFERRVSYWRTQPGLSIFLTLVSLGVYLPFSLIPLDPEERLQPVEHFEVNHFVLRLEQGGYQPWERALDLTGEKEVDIQADLAPAPGPMQEAPL